MCAEEPTFSQCRVHIEAAIKGQAPEPVEDVTPVITGNFIPTTMRTGG